MVLLSFFFNSKVECFFIAIFSNSITLNDLGPWVVQLDSRSSSVSQNEGFHGGDVKSASVKNCRASKMRRVIVHFDRMEPALSSSFIVDDRVTDSKEILKFRKRWK